MDKQKQVQGGGWEKGKIFQNLKSWNNINSNNLLFFANSIKGQTKSRSANLQQAVMTNNNNHKQQQ